MAPAAAMALNEKTHVVHQRFTKAGGHLWYRLEVIQQPERARACGSGPKCWFCLHLIVYRASLADSVS